MIDLIQIVVMIMHLFLVNTPMNQLVEVIMKSIALIVVVVGMKGLKTASIHIKINNKYIIYVIFSRNLFSK